MIKSSGLPSLIFATALAAVLADLKINFSNSNGKILGGSDAPEGAYPYMVSLRYRGTHGCEASIIHPEWILTAPHCVRGVSTERMAEYVGSNKLSSGGTTHKVLAYYYHEEHKPIRIKNDIALIKVKPITLSETVQPVILDSETLDDEQPCYLSGWGFLNYPEGDSPNNLQHIKLKTITARECRRRQIYYNRKSEICTFTKAGEGACKADSGSPLVRIVNGTVKQIGLDIWSIPCARGFPDMYTRVSNFVPWIKATCNNCI